MRLLVLIAALVLVRPAASQRVGAPTTDLDKLSVDDLFNIQVTSVGKKAEQVSKAPAAVFVLTSDDIRRTGATCIPEALQWVPGLTVLRLDARNWIVSARGGARTYANKILVMIDGRSLYTPLFGGVIWDAIGVPMDDIERIEVIRGPGAVMWGLNAVNGVINIITKATKATKGGQLSASTGNEVRESTDVRWGGGAGDNLSYRVWGQSDYLTPAYGSSGVFPVDQISLHTASAVTNLDAATTRFGFRMDGQSGGKDAWTIQGDLYKMDRQDPTFTTGLEPGSLDSYQGHTQYDGGYLQGSWTRTASAAGESSLQFTYGSDSLTYPGLGADVHNLTVDYQNRQQTSDRNEVYWGVGYQRYWDQISGGPTISFDPANSGYEGGDVVVRDEYQLIPGRWLVSAGARLDYTSYSHLQYQPSVRLLFTPDSEHSLWFGVSRALRQPSRIDLNMDINAGTSLDEGLPLTTRAMGSPNLRPEVERSLEAGYKMQSGQRWSLDFSVFWSYYQSLVALASPAPTVTFTNGAPNIDVTGYTNNAGSGRSYGGEVWGEIQVRPGWRIVPAYSYLSEERWLPPNGSFMYSSFAEIASFPHQGELRSQFDLSRTLKFDVMARARSRDTELGLPGTLLADVRLSWRPARATEVSVTAKDIANRQVYEGYPEGFAIAIPTRRTVVFQLRQRF